MTRKLTKKTKIQELEGIIKQLNQNINMQRQIISEKEEKLRKINRILNNSHKEHKVNLK